MPARVVSIRLLVHVRSALARLPGADSRMSYRALRMVLRPAMPRNLFRKCWKLGINAICIPIPVTVLLRHEPAGWRHLPAERRRLETSLDLYSDGVHVLIRNDLGRYGWEDAHADALPVTQAGRKGMLPDAVTAGQRDWQERTLRGARKRERTRREIRLNAQDGPLREDDQALPLVEHICCCLTQPAVSPATLFRRDTEVPRGAQVATEEAPAKELVPRGEAQMEGEVQQGQNVRESFVERRHDVPGVGRDMFESRNLQLDAEVSNDAACPPAFDAMHRPPRLQEAKACCHSGRRPQPERHPA